MFKLIFPENGNLEDVVIEHDFTALHQNPAFVAAAKKFESYLEANAAALNIPQTAVTGICHLAADATSAAMNLAYEEGLLDGFDLAQQAQQLDNDDDLPGLPS